MIKKEQVTILIDAVVRGMTVSDACALSGISRETFYLWRRTDEGFDRTIQKAELGAKKESIDIIHLSARKHWQAAAWWLERKYPEEFGSKRELKVVSAQNTIEDWKFALGISEAQLSGTRK